MKKIIKFSALEDFCKLIKKYLLEGPNNKLYSSISKKLNLSSPNEVQNCIECLIYLLLLFTILNVNQFDFNNTLYHIGFRQDDVDKILFKFYNNERYNLYKTLINEYIHLLHFKYLHWRFEGVIATRSHLKQCEPMFTVRLNLENKTDHSNKEFDLQFSVDSIINVTKSLEEVLTYAKQTQRKLSRRRQSKQIKLQT